MPPTTVQSQPCATCGLPMPAGAEGCAQGHVRPRRVALQCDCCGSETLAERCGDKVVIRARRHGREHILVLPLDKRETPFYPHNLELKDLTRGG